MVDQQRQKSEKQFRIITLLVAGAALVDFACKACGVWR